MAGGLEARESIQYLADWKLAALSLLQQAAGRPAQTGQVQELQEVSQPQALATKLHLRPLPLLALQHSAQLPQPRHLEELSIQRLRGMANSFQTCIKQGMSLIPKIVDSSECEESAS